MCIIIYMYVYVLLYIYIYTCYIIYIYVTVGIYIPLRVLMLCLQEQSDKKCSVKLWRKQTLNAGG